MVHVVASMSAYTVDVLVSIPITVFCSRSVKNSRSVRGYSGHFFGGWCRKKSISFNYGAAGAGYVWATCIAYSP